MNNHGYWAPISRSTWPNLAVNTKPKKHAGWTYAVFSWTVRPDGTGPAVFTFHNVGEVNGTESEMVAALPTLPWGKVVSPDECAALESLHYTHVPLTDDMKMDAARRARAWMKSNTVAFLTPHETMKQEMLDLKCVLLPQVHWDQEDRPWHREVVRGDMDYVTLFLLAATVEPEAPALPENPAPLVPPPAPVGALN